MEDQAQQTINDAVKWALATQTGQRPSTKRQKKETDFKSKDNQLRYEVNGDILQTVEAAIKTIDNKELDVAKAELEKGKCIITKQQKLIRIADREDNGWEVVKHYLSDELASDSDDEKAISKARRKALASVNKRKAKKQEQFWNAPPPPPHTHPYKSQKFQRDGAGRKNWGGGLTLKTELRSIDVSCQHVRPAERKGKLPIWLYLRKRRASCQYVIPAERKGKLPICYTCGKEGHFQLHTQIQTVNAKCIIDIGSSPRVTKLVYNFL